MHSVILTMSLMSSSVYIVYLLIRPLLKRFFSVRLRLNILKIALIYSLLPFPLLKISYVNFIRYFYDFSKININTVYLREYKRILPDGTTIYPKLFYIMAVLSGIGILVACILLIYKQKCYKDFRKNIDSYCKDNKNNYIKTVFEETKKEYHIKRKVSILNSGFLKPMTVGMLRPKVILPDNYLSEQQTEHIIKHELMHIKRMDYFYKILLLFATSLHWFNPFIHLLSKEIDKLLEYCTDEAVVLKMNEEERKNYGLTIINMGAFKPSATNTNLMPISFFGSNSEKQIKARLSEMKNVRSHNKLNYFLSIVILLGIFFLNSNLILAYEDYPIDDYSDDKISYESGDFDVSFSVNENGASQFSDDSIYLDNTLSLFSENVQSIFVDNNGTVYPIYKDADAETDATCSHAFVSGTKTTHIKNSTGGCTVYIYEAQYCSKCGYTKNKNLINQITYAVCTH